MVEDTQMRHPSSFSMQVACYSQCTIHSHANSDYRSQSGRHLTSRTLSRLHVVQGCKQGCPFWVHIPEIWSQIALVGPKIFVWPFGTYLAVFQVWFSLLQKLDPANLDPVWETIFFTNGLQIFNKFLNVEGFRLQNFIRSFRSKFSRNIVTCYNCRGSSEDCYVSDYLVRCVSFPSYTCLFTLARLLVIPLALNKDKKFISVHGYIWKLVILLLSSIM